MDPTTDAAQQLIEHARSLHERVERVLADRAAIAQGAQRAAAELVPRTGNGGPVAFAWLILSPADEQAVADLRRAEAQPQLGPEAGAWLESMRASLPSAIADAEPKPRRLLDRIFGRHPNAEVQSAALGYLQSEVARAQHPEVAATLQLPFEVPITRPHNAEELCRTIVAALPDRPRAAHALTTGQTQRVRAALETLRTADLHIAEAAAAADAAAQAVLEAGAQRALAEVDMERFRTQIPGRFPVSALAGAGIRTVADILSAGTAGLDAIHGISSTMATTLMRHAQDLQIRARDQAQIDLTRTAEPALLTLIERCHESQRLSLIHRDDAEDRELGHRLGTIPQPPFTASDPRDLFAPGLGASPSLIVADGEAGARDAAAQLLALADRVEEHRRADHLSKAERQRCAAAPLEDLAEHTALYVAQLSAMGYEKRIVTNTHGDLPEPLVRLIEDVDLDTTLLTVPSLRRYQQFAARFALLQKRVIVGDEMGLGKTVEALATITHLHRQGQDRTLVICPASVLTNWMREVTSKTTLSAFRLHGPGRDEAVQQWQAAGGVGITTFSTLSALLRGGKFATLDTVVVDEAHKIKNPAAQRTKAAQRQIDRAQHAILMTGTPLENRLEEFRTLLGYMNPQLGRDAEGLLPAAFRRHIAPAYLRRNQEDVLRELPDLVEVEDWVEFSDVDRQHYEAAVAASNFMGMRQAAMRGGMRSVKIEQLIDICEEAIENHRKVLVFSYFRDALEAMARLLPGPVFGPLTGSVSPEQRQLLVDEFSARSGGAILISQIEAGGEGLNIQAASVVVICEPQLKPSLEVQAIARAYRMGQQHSVQVHRMLSEEGVDPRLVELLAHKSEVFDDYARESATKDGHGASIQVDEVSVQKTVLTEERKRLGLDEGEPSRNSADENPAPPHAQDPELAVSPHPAVRPIPAPRDPVTSPGSGYTVIDLETTGLAPGRHHRVLELGVVQVSPTGEIEDEWSTLLNPGRDIPNSHIHHITAGDVVAAPTFREILPRLSAAAEGRVLVAHNAPFDVGFLVAEMERAGCSPAEPLPSLCTMQWSGAFLDSPSRKLIDCCRSAGIDLDNAHSAAGDARATAALLGHYLSLLDGSPLPWQQILDDAQRFEWPATGVPADAAPLLHREEVRAAAPAGWLERMTSSMPTAAGVHAEAYLDVLERALLDGVLSHHEKEELLALASDLGLSGEEALRLHASYLDALAEIVVADGVVTDEERDELDRTSAALGLSATDIDRALDRAEAHRAGGIAPARESIRTAGIVLEAGDRIVFTGSMRRGREEWEDVARQLGLDPGDVTRKTRLVVAGDPDSLSGKAAKARSYGIPIITETAFARMLEQGELPGPSDAR